MSKLPNYIQAVIPLEKLSEYALNPDHPTGRHKARVFKAALGLTLADVYFLQSKIQQATIHEEAFQQDATPYGDRYVLDFNLTTAVGRATIRTAWIILHEEDFPRLTTCYVLEA
jgi:hypothetical protein